MNYSKMTKYQKDLYQKRFENYNDIQRLCWSNKETQYIRFETILKHMLPCKMNKIFSIHDFGCGVGDLHKYLLYNNIKHIYSGTEIVPEMVKEIKNKYPYVKILNRDIMKEKITYEEYDYVISSGTFNRKNIKFGNWENYVFLLIKKLFSMSKIAFGFNFLTTYNNFESDDCLYLDPRKIIDYCIKNISRFFIIDFSIPLYDGSFIIYKEDYIKKKYKKNEYKKYFCNDIY